MADYIPRKIKTIFLAGLLTIIPVLITIILLVYLFNIFEKILAHPVTMVLRLIGLQQLVGYHISGLLGLGLLGIISFFLGWW